MCRMDGEAFKSRLVHRGELTIINFLLLLKVSLLRNLLKCKAYLRTKFNAHALLSVP